jgi:hypothetical protein
MKITASDLELQSNHHARTRQESSENLRAWRGQRPNFEQRENGNRGLPSAIADISAAARQAFAASTPSAVPPAPTSAPSGQAQAIDSAIDAADNDPFIILIKRMLELLTGEEIRSFDAQAFSVDVRQVEVKASRTGASQEAAASGRAGWGVEYDFHAVQEEFESTSFSASGTIRTADGQEISFNLDVEMTRYYREETNVSLRAGDAVRKDPLVVNFDGTAAQLAGQSERRFSFDLDGDGRKESLPGFASGSGFLALDLNGNGRIDSGRELFGPATGNGFTELARLDDDGNGWIDENDASFDKLSVWTPDAKGNGELKSLADLGIGALGLGHVATPFALRGADNADLGQVKASGVYLTETGKAGSLQEIDLTI